MAGFELIGEDALDRLHNDPDLEVKFNYCARCRIAMDSIHGSYECSRCGYIERLDGEIRDCIEDGSTNLKMSTGRLVYNMTSDYGKTQRKVLLEQLMQNNADFSGDKIPHDVLVKAVEKYNEIQRSDQLDKFVKRGNIKDEILAALVHFMCIDARITRKKADIARFMKLRSAGFSRGEDTLRGLRAIGIIQINLNSESAEHFLSRYLEALGITPETTRDAHRCKEFTLKLGDATRRVHIGLTSTLPSQVVGTLWVFIQHGGVADVVIDIAKMQSMCDGVKRNTWMRFYNAIMERKLQFIDLFDRYGVDHGMRGRLVRRSEVKTAE